MPQYSIISVYIQNKTYYACLSHYFTDARLVGLVFYIEQEQRRHDNAAYTTYTISPHTWPLAHAH